MIQGKPGSHKRALRRHHDKRKKAWVRKTLDRYFMYATDLPARRVGMYSRTPKVCSCFMCGNPRRFHQKPAIQERRAMLELDELLSEAASPYPFQSSDYADYKKKERRYRARVVRGDVAEDLFDRGLCLPSGTAMTDGDLNRVIDTILNCSNK